MTPGEVIKGMLPFEGLTITELARNMGMSRSHLYRVIWGEVRITPKMAKRLSKHLAYTPEHWLMLQAKHDAQDAEHER